MEVTNYPDFEYRHYVTTNDTWTTIWTLPTANNSVGHIKLMLVAVKSDGTKSLVCDLIAAWKNSGGTLTRDDYVSNMTHRDDPDWNCELEVSGTDFILKVKGKAAETITWQAKINKNILVG